MTSAGRLDGKKWPASRTRRNSACGQTSSNSLPVRRACELSPYIARIGKRIWRSESSVRPSSPISSASAEVLSHQSQPLRRGLAAAVGDQRTDELLERGRHRLAIELHPRHLGQKAIAEVRIAGVELHVCVVQQRSACRRRSPRPARQRHGRAEMWVSASTRLAIRSGAIRARLSAITPPKLCTRKCARGIARWSSSAFEIARQVLRACSRRPASRSGRGRAGRRP